MNVMEYWTRKKKVAVLLAVAVVVIVVVAALWMYVIPRTEMHVQTVYHEGSTSVINVHVKLTNRGTVRAERITVNVMVMNSSMTFLDETENIDSLAPGDDYEVKNHYFGNQLEQYYVTVTLDFETGSEHFSEVFEYQPGGYMTESWEDTVEKLHV